MGLMMFTPKKVNGTLFELLIDALQFDSKSIEIGVRCCLAFSVLDCLLLRGSGFKSWPSQKLDQDFSKCLQSMSLSFQATLGFMDIVYDSPTWWVFTTAEQRNRLERLLLRLRRACFLPAKPPSFEELARDAALGAVQAYLLQTVPRS